MLKFNIKLAKILKNYYYIVLHRVFKYINSVHAPKYNKKYVIKNIESFKSGFNQLYFNILHIFQKLK